MQTFRATRCGRQRGLGARGRPVASGSRRVRHAAPHAWRGGPAAVDTTHPRSRTPPRGPTPAAPGVVRCRAAGQVTGVDGAEGLPPDQLIELRLPAAPASVAVVRVALAAVAEQVGLSHDDIVELKIAASEACGAILARGATGALTVRARRVGPRLAVEVSGAVLNAESDGQDQLRLGLLRALVDGLDFRLDPPHAVVRITRGPRT